jgi:hypothetical protein
MKKNILLYKHLMRWIHRLLPNYCYHPNCHLKYLQKNLLIQFCFSMMNIFFFPLSAFSYLLLSLL